MELLTPPIFLTVSDLLLPLISIVFMPVKDIEVVSAAWDPFRRMIVYVFLP